MSNRKQIFIVEDETIIAFTIESTLLSLGFDVLGHARSGEECLDFLEIKRPDLILMDIKLDGKLNGIKTANEIRIKYNIPVIFLSAYSTFELIEMAKEANPYGYIVKPFQARDLQSGIELALHKHEYEKRLIESENRYKNLVNTINEGILQLSLEDDTIEFVNEIFCNVFELQKDEVMGKNVFDTIYFFKEQEEMIMSKKTNRLKGDNERYEVRIVTKSGEEKWFLISGAAIKNESGKIVSSLTVWLDITDKKHYVNELKKFHNTIEQSEELIVITNKTGVIEYVNPRFSDVTGYTLNEIKGKTPRLLKSGRHSKDFYKDFWTIINSGKSYLGEFINRKKNGNVFFEEKIVTPLFDENKEIINFISTGRDITERKSIEKKIEAYKKLQIFNEKKHARIRTLSLIQGQEEERKRIARDLHDGLGQILTATKINLERMNVNGIITDGKAKDLKKIYDLVGETIQEVRRISNDLSPSGLHDFGLLSAVKILVANISEYQKQFVIYVNANIEGLRFAPDIEINVYRIIQESLNNAMKYSKCSYVEINLSLFENTLKVSIMDNGIGFVKIKSNEHIEKRKLQGGLKNIEERAKIIGGELNVISDPGNGVLISFQIKTNAIKYDKNFTG